MHGVGFREWVALGVLAVAGVIGFMFFDPTSTDGNGDEGPRIISLGTPEPTRSSVTPEPSPTPVPVRQLGEPGGGWYVVYYEVSPSGGDLKVGEGVSPRLDIDVPGRPFPDVRDDGWRVAATQQVKLDAGRYRFALETDGAVKVTVENTTVLDAADEGSAQRREIVFDHPGGNASIIINMRDTGGPVRLRWVE